MATNNGGTRRGGNRTRGGRNNNPEGRNQHSGLIGASRDNPLTAAAVVGGAVAAGVFLWSRRNQISDQLGDLADRISDLRDGMGSDGALGSGASSDTRTQAEIAEEALTLKETGRTS